MKIDFRQQLDFNNVLIRPQRTTISSRSEVSLDRTFYFKNSNTNWTGVPIIASNMDTIGTFNVSEVLNKYKMLTCLNKFYSVVEYHSFLSQKKNELNLKDYTEYIKNIVISVGIGKDDIIKLHKVLNIFPEIQWICIDVANGYMNKMVTICKTIRKKYPNKIFPNI